MIGYVPGVDDDNSVIHGYVPICCQLAGPAGSEDGSGELAAPDALLDPVAGPVSEQLCVAAAVRVQPVIAGYRVTALDHGEDLPVSHVYRWRPGQGSAPAAT
jgi:hypothetical protein